ncbi:MAG: tetratricopeptide repeat protein [Gammaproteobacteria bacterium]
MKSWLLILLLPWLLAGCVLERYSLPDDYRPAHETATAPLADGAIFQGRLDAQKGGALTLRFVKTGANRYLVEHLALMPDGDEPALPPTHVHFLPLGGTHYALHWRRLGDTTQGYALVRLDAGHFLLLEPLSQSSTLALAEAHGIAAQPPGVAGGYTLNSRDEARVLAFFKDLATRKTEPTLTLAATDQAPTALRARTLAKLAVHIPRLTRERLGTIGDEEAVVAWAQGLAREGNGHGQYLLARLLANGWGTPVDGPAALREADAAMKSGVPQAGHVAAYVLYHGLGMPADPGRALPYARRAADAGSPGAMMVLGFAYGNGRGVALDRAEARRWMKRAADLDYGPAHAQWADLLLDDRTAASDAQAVAALEAGIKAGDANAHSLRGFMHENGRGGPQDYAAATAHFLEAAKRRHAYATYLAGERLRRGQGIPQDIIRGRKLLARAAKAGVAEAQAALARSDVVLPGTTCVRGLCGNSLADATPHPRQAESPYVFAGLRFGASYGEAIRVFGEPERIDASTASTELFWANGKFEVSYRAATGFINGFTVTGPEGAAFVRARAPAERLLRLLDLPKDQVPSLMGPPTKVWYDDRRMDWDHAIDSRRDASVFLECTRGAERTCDSMMVHWSGAATSDPNDGVDAQGLRVSPVCARDTSYRSSLERSGFVRASGHAQTPSWALELYSHPASRRWVLMGKYLEPSIWAETPAPWELCELAKGVGDPRAQPWYATYFKT